MSLRTPHSQDSFPLKVHLSPEAIAFLESKYPNLDPEIGIVHLVEEAMDRAKRTAAARVQVLEHPAYAAPQPPKPLEPLQPQGELQQPEQSWSNPLGTLQEYCQQKSLPLPEYEFEPCTEGFSCQVRAAGHSGSGTGVNKKLAKANAAAALLATLEP